MLEFKCLRTRRVSVADLTNIPSTILNTKVNIVAEQDVFTGDNDINLYPDCNKCARVDLQFLKLLYIFIHVTSL